MVAYKYVDLEWADDVASGSILIGTLRSYGNIPEHLRDKNEGKTVVLVQDYDGSGSNSDDHGAISALGFPIQTNLHFSISNSIFMNTIPDKFCFCMGRTPDNPHLLKGGKAVFEVSNTHDLLIAVQNKFSDRIYAGTEDRVYYQPRIGIFDPKNPILKDPFAKCSTYYIEDEHRIIWLPYPGKEPAPFPTGPTPEIAALLRRVS